MKKLKLDLDDIAVESFQTDAARVAKGTVMGQAEYTAVADADTCQASCMGGCETVDGCESFTDGWDCRHSIYETCDWPAC